MSWEFSQFPSPRPPNIGSGGRIGSLQNPPFVCSLPCPNETNIASQFALIFKNSPEPLGQKNDLRQHGTGDRISRVSRSVWVIDQRACDLTGLPVR